MIFDAELFDPVFLKLYIGDRPHIHQSHFNTLFRRSTRVSESGRIYLSSKQFKLKSPRWLITLMTILLVAGHADMTSWSKSVLTLNHFNYRLSIIFTRIVLAIGSSR
jgi:hypothetical protein